MREKERERAQNTLTISCLSFNAQTQQQSSCPLPIFSIAIIVPTPSSLLLSTTPTKNLKVSSLSSFPGARKRRNKKEREKDHKHAVHVFAKEEVLAEDLAFFVSLIELLAYLLLGFEWRVVSSFLRLSLKLESLLLLGNQASWSDYLLVSSKLITQVLTYMCSSLLLRWTS